ncbi:hypothetical protein Xsto_02376 [Xenorhabdus stockiae]|uniref:Uncharacterized protein n=1 Tax=Xenorhabdus stockiae TaxID=351614 RepID=A0A2D0KNR4_9GAMM|nr:hypothetical protein Xsto_02376 [Xenorhabdus stockiae]
MKLEQFKLKQIKLKQLKMWQPKMRHLKDEGYKPVFSSALGAVYTTNAFLLPRIAFITQLIDSNIYR